MKLPEQEKTTSYWVGALLGSIVLIAAIPLVPIWAINTLFGTDIPFTFMTWLASFCLTAMFNGAKINGAK